MISTMLGKRAAVVVLLGLGAQVVFGIPLGGAPHVQWEAVRALAMGEPQPVGAVQHMKATDLTVELRGATYLPAQTVVDLVIYDGALLSADRAWQPIATEDLRLGDMQPQRVQQSGNSVRGRWRVLLDLPPVAGVTTLEILRLRRSGITGPEVIQGPWVFTLNPQPTDLVAAAAGGEVAVNETKEDADHRLTVDKVQTSAKETTVHYRSTDKLNQQREPLGRPRLEYDGQTVYGSVARGQTPGEFAAKFAVVPPPGRNVTLTLPAAQTKQNERVQITVPLPALPALTAQPQRVAMNQTVQTAGRSYRFTAIAVSDSAFTLTYEPADEPTRSLPLAAPLSRIVARDGQGNAYAPSQQDTSWDEATFTMKASTVTFAGKLPANTGEIVLDVDGLGRIAQAPGKFSFVSP